ncbi:MAG: hypothetical protein KF774_04015 [Planctomyces sp.]|nr:hypothetical protein [Planctomyces sp.]
MALEFLKVGPRITLVPVLHGSGDFAVAIRRLMLTEKFDCLAVPLPPSFQAAVEQGIERLPAVSAVIQRESPAFRAADWTPDSDRDDEEEDAPKSASYVPIDPCQPVIAALRVAMQERIPREYIDFETRDYLAATLGLPDPYALKQTSLDRFAAAVLPALPRLPAGQATERVAWMAHRLKQLSRRRKSILCLCAMTDWPWIREAYADGATPPATDDDVEDADLHAVDPATLIFMLGELPHITGLYERARAELDDDENLSLDGVKDLLLTSRERYRQDLKSRARKITPHLLATSLKYIRNLCLIERRLTPDLYTLIVASRQMAGDQFAIHVAETAREYPFLGDDRLPPAKFGIGRVQLPDGDLLAAKSRLPGQPVCWRTLQLNRRPPKIDQMRWAMQWNPFSHCSWPPEDIAIERFRTHIKDHALNLLGHDLARTEKFSASLKDGLDIRETLRNWHTGDLYVKVLPPTRGNLDCVIMLFDSPADPRDYPWRITWHAESHDESTLSFYATHFGQGLVGPGIAQATYGGAMFLFPPRNIPDIWRNSRFDFVDTLEERLLAAACAYSEERHIALLSAVPPGPGWRRLAKKGGKRLIHVPLAHFSQETLQQLRMFHVLNGRKVRSYAEHFIRKA